MTSTTPPALPPDPARAPYALSARSRAAVTVDAAAVSSIDRSRQPLGPFLRLLWNLAPPLLQPPEQGAPDELSAPVLSARGLHVPHVPDDVPASQSGAWYRSVAAHAAAHMVFSARIFRRKGTAPITQALIGLLEDARVEALACAELPGLRKLWRAWHTVRPEDGEDFETLMLRLSRSLSDPGFDDPHPWVRKGRAGFAAQFGDAGSGAGGAQAAPHAPPGGEAAALRRLASALGHDLGQMRMAFNPRRHRPGPSYRDDNRWLWLDDAAETGASAPAPAPARVEQAPSHDLPPETVQWRYGEWDHRIATLRPDWSTVHERRAANPVSVAGMGSAMADSAQGEGIASSRHDQARQLRSIIERAARHGRRWQRRERDGDEIELEEALRFAMARRAGASADDRVHRSLVRQPVETAVFVLVDVSASTAEPYGAEAGATRLLVQQEVATRLAIAMAMPGWRLAVQGFCSNGRHEVVLSRIKDFAEEWDEGGILRLSALRSRWSTRLGAALRHATRSLLLQPASRRIMLVLSDGEPHDVDIHDPRYLGEDARHAVRQATAAGIEARCLLFDGQGAETARHVFGTGHSALLRELSSLPHAVERLLS